MRKIEFTPEVIEQLQYESVYNERPIVRRRMFTLLLKSRNLAHKEIAATLGISETTVREYFDLYLEGGVEALKEVGYKGKENLLRARRDEIIAALEANPPATLKEAREVIKEVTGLERSLPQVSAFLQEHKIIRRKVKQIPDKADSSAGGFQN